MGAFDDVIDQYPLIKIGGRYISSTEALLALGKALIKKGIISKAEILAEL